MYKITPNQARTSETKEAFLELTNEELKHIKYLEILFNKIKNKDGDIKLVFEVSPSFSDIYNWKNVDKECILLAMCVFNIAI